MSFGKKLLLDLDRVFYNIRLNVFASIYGMPPRPFTRKLKELYGCQFLDGAEIGVMLGDNADSILKTVNIKHLYLIDPFIEYAEYHDDCSGFGMSPSDELYRKVQLRFSEKNTTVIRKYSDEAINDVPDLDFCYIDGNHAYEYVKRDIELYWEKIRPGGMLGGHDIDNGTCQEHDGITKAVSEFAVINNFQLYVSSPDWWFMKPRDVT